MDLVRPVSIIDKSHFVNVAQRLAEEMNENKDPISSRGFFCDQFENLANFQVGIHKYKF